MFVNWIQKRFIIKPQYWKNLQFVSQNLRCILWISVTGEIVHWPYDTHYANEFANGHGAGERHDCTCLSGKHWQFIVTIVDGYIPVIIGSKALMREKTKIIAIYVWRYLVNEKYQYRPRVLTQGEALNEGRLLFILVE